jgi:nitrite reductase (NADH) small subunit
MHRVGSVSDFPLGVFKIYDIKKRPIGVVRTKAGFFAVRNRCPHQGAELCKGYVTGTHLPSDPQVYDYTDDRAVVQCPWHRWEFDLETGRTVEGVANKRVATYDVHVAGDDVYVNLRARKEIVG